MSGSELLHFFVAMVAITNPIGNVAIFLSLTADRTTQEQRKLAIATAIAVGVVLLVITWIGTPLLHFFGISLSAFQAAGGLVVLLLGLSMLQSKTSPITHTSSEHEQAKQKDSIAVVPMSIPIIAGPGAMTTVIIFSHQHAGVLDKVYLSATNIIIAILLGTLLFFAGVVHKCLGDAGVKIATRVMGLILAAIAVGMIATGLKALMPGLA